MSQIHFYDWTDATVSWRWRRARHSLCSYYGGGGGDSDPTSRQWRYDVMTLWHASVLSRFLATTVPQQRTHTKQLIFGRRASLSCDNGSPLLVVYELKFIISTIAAKRLSAEPPRRLFSIYLVFSGALTVLGVCSVFPFAHRPRPRRYELRQQNDVHRLRHGQTQVAAVQKDRFVRLRQGEWRDIRTHAVQLGWVVGLVNFERCCCLPPFANAARHGPAFGARHRGVSSRNARRVRRRFPLVRSAGSLPSSNAVQSHQCYRVLVCFLPSKSASFRIQ